MKSIERGFVISKLNYSESSLIIRCFTERYGLKSFLFQGAKKKNASILWPLAPIEFSAYLRNDSQLTKMTDAQWLFPISNLPFDPIKGALTFFMAETLSNTLHENLPNEALFDFLVQELQWFDQTEIYANYPIFWLLALCQLEGIYPLVSDGSYFDLKNGCFSSFPPTNHLYKEGAIVDELRGILLLDKTHLLALQLPKELRRDLLKLVIEYMSHHFPAFKQLKSLEVIETVWYD